MESRRMALIALIGVILYLLYQAWQTDYPPPVPVAQQSSTTEVSANATPAAPGVAVDGAVATPPATAQRIRVVTDLFSAEFVTTGAELRRVELLNYPKEKATPDVKLALLDDQDGHLFTLQSGLALAAGSKQLASSQTPYTSAQSEYRLEDGAQTLEVPFEYVDANGYTLRKVFTFKRGSYEIDLKQTLLNHSGGEITASPYARLLHNGTSKEKQAPFVRTFSGLGVYQQKAGSTDYAFKKEKLDELTKNPYESKQAGGWIAILQHYFMAAVIPPADEALTFSGKPSGNGNYAALYQGPSQPVADGAEQNYALKLYVGPKVQGQLDAVAKGLELTEDYGILTPIAKPLFTILNLFHGLIGNWGWSIVLLTLLVKAVFYPLSAAQYRSMAKMKKFGPRLTEIRERHAGDRERLNQAMMDLYKKEGFNPLAGCWPMLVQMPVFFSLYWVLVESVELRQAPFMLWVGDLSAADPLYILPILYGFTMWLQQRMSGQSATMDPTQAKIMNIMPIAFTGMFLFFPAGLVVYWLVSNVVGIAQQKLIIWQMDKKPARAAA